MHEHNIKMPKYQNAKIVLRLNVRNSDIHVLIYIISVVSQDGNGSHLEFLIEQENTVWNEFLMRNIPLDVVLHTVFFKENKQLQDSSGGHIAFMHVQNLKINK